MHRLAWLTSALVACGSGPATNGADAGSDVSTDHVACAVDFPCAASWACSDATHWIGVHSVAKPPCSGLTCESTGETGVCDSGLECVSSSGKTDHPTDRCAYGGVDGCLPGDASAFVPTAMGPAPARTPDACDQTTIEQYWIRCYDPASRDDASCTYWQNHNATCGACLAQTLVVAAWDTESASPTLLPNVAGCYAASGDSTCASMADANAQCAVAVCNAGCASDPRAYAACVAAATTTACSSFSRCGADAGAYATCDAPAEKDFFLGFGEALCGP